MILIFTKKFDYSTTCVMRWLKFLGKEVRRINVDDDGYKLDKISGEGILFRNTRTGELVNLNEASACWWRRNGISQQTFCGTALPQRLTAGDIDLSPFVHGPKNLISREARDLTEFIYESVYQSCQINLGRPVFNLNKLIVLKKAEAAGLTVPGYQVITNTRELKNIHAESARYVSKAISNGIYDEIENKRFYTYTEQIDNEWFEDEPDVSLYPSLAMELIEKKAEVRSFFIAGKFFSMQIKSQSSQQTSVDFRKYNIIKPNRTDLFKLPSPVEDKLEVLFDSVGLNCGSVDLIITKNNDYVFLEINPVGQYSMVGEPCNYNLDRLIANYLIYGTLG